MNHTAFLKLLSPRAAGLFLGVAVLSFADGGQAQSTEEVPLGEFSAIRFVPAPGPGNYLMTEGARVSGHLNGSAGIFAEYAHRPFVLYDVNCTSEDTSNCTLEDPEVDIVGYTTSIHLMGTLALLERLQIALDVPLIVSSSEGFEFTRDGAPVGIQGGSGVAVGDLRLSLKGRIHGTGDGLTFAASLYGTAPIAQLTATDRFVGDNGPTVGGHFIAEFIREGVRFAANIGGVYRDTTHLFSTSTGSQLTYSIAGGYDVTSLLGVFAELEGASSFTAELDENPLEVRAGARLRQGDFLFLLGAGTGIISGVGVPTFRVGAGAMWAPERGDADEDGVNDGEDACPSVAEDQDRWDDRDGCPEGDNDGDELADNADSCPNEPEDVDQVQDEDGCPDADNDGDQVPDGFDSCPMEPEDRDGDRDDDGCPEYDRDRDGVADTADQCPEEAEDTDGFGDEDGCPEVDFDNDTVPDDGDQCPDELEDADGYQDDDGCPEPESAPPPRRTR